MTVIETGLGVGLTIEWRGDGGYAPRCELCNYVGKTRSAHADAMAACRAHQRSRTHWLRVQSWRAEGR